MRGWLLLGLCVAGNVLAESAYRWVDAQGKVHFSDRPPATGSGKVEKRVLTAPAADSQPGYALREASAKFPVALYVSEECGDACTQARGLLKQRNIPFAEINVTGAEGLDALVRLTGGKAEVPVLRVGSRIERGFLDSAWNSLLDAAGYPRAP